MLKLFFDFKPDFKIKNRQGYTPLALSAVLGRKEVNLITNHESSINSITDLFYCLDIFFVERPT